MTEVFDPPFQAHVHSTSPAEPVDERAILMSLPLTAEQRKQMLEYLDKSEEDRDIEMRDVEEQIARGEIKPDLAPEEKESHASLAEILHQPKILGL